MEIPFKYRTSLIKHRGDVRGVKALDNDKIVSCSRDNYAILWTQNVEDPLTFDAETNFAGHSNYVSCVEYLKPSEYYPEGAIITGCNDNTIRIYTETSNLPVSVLKGHQDSISCLSTSPNGLIISGSWDCTVKVWRNSNAIASFTAHQSAVWSVKFIEFENGSLLLASGSADKTIKLWRITLPKEDDLTGSVSNASLVRTLQGHTDCVRSLVTYDRERLISASNDGSLRVWNVNTGACIAQFLGHSNYVYSMALSLDRNLLASSGEDGTARIWPGQLLVIKEEGKAFCYQWSMSENNWAKVGEVVGSQGSKKKMYQGKEYDFVFDVDFDPNRPAVKLPFNRNQDPWVVAQDFILKYDLPQDYLETIFQYIQKNAGLEKTSHSFRSAGPSDPYTGDSRYLMDTDASWSRSYFPATTLVPMDNVNMAALTTKLKTLNEQLTPKLDKDLIDNQIAKLNRKSVESDVEKITSAVLSIFPSWPIEHQLPLLDILRFTVLWKSSCQLVFLTCWPTILQSSLKCGELPQKNCLLVLRLLCNSIENVKKLALEQGELQPLKQIFESTHDVLEMALRGCFQLDKADSKMMQVALATLFHNLVVLGSDTDTVKTLSHKVPSLRALSGLCVRFSFLQLRAVYLDASKNGIEAIAYAHPEAIFRNLVTLGTGLTTISQDKMDRVSLLTDLLAASDKIQTPEPGSNLFASQWEQARNSIAFWASNESLLAKSRECASAILKALD
ncbi:hypothetical protein Ciccas_009142 [Cichlidogyrus casuarinus]|uniref:Phospholipase A-2-activating protein n=1 Tax=Cichlidogyrus casuarinus TaxID=1844966 RepID=A0ABD2PYA9_9PLAT